MAAKLRSLSLLLLLILTFQEMMPNEAAECKSKSKVFKGLCVNRASCSVICVAQGFLYGECRKFKCICAKKCKAYEGDYGPPEGGSGGDYEPPEGGRGGGEGEEEPPKGGRGGRGGRGGGEGEEETPKGGRRGRGGGEGEKEPPVEGGGGEDEE